MKGDRQITTGHILGKNLLDERGKLSACGNKTKGLNQFRMITKGEYESQLDIGISVVSDSSAGEMRKVVQIDGPPRAKIWQQESKDALREQPFLSAPQDTLCWESEYSRVSE